MIKLSLNSEFNISNICKRSPCDRQVQGFRKRTQSSPAFLYQSNRAYIVHNRNESLTMNVSKLQSHCYVSTDGNNLIVPLSEPRKTDLVPGKLSGTTVFRFTTQAEPSIQISHDDYIIQTF